MTEIQQSQQAEIDSLIFQVADMKSRLNDNYTAGQTSMYLTKQAEIDNLKAQLKAVHESRADFVEYCRMIESNDFVLVPKEPTQTMLDSARDWSTKKYGRAVGNDGTSGCYKAMIEAQEQVE